MISIRNQKGSSSTKQPSLADRKGFALELNPLVFWSSLGATEPLDCTARSPHTCSCFKGVSSWWRMNYIGFQETWFYKSHQIIISCYSVKNIDSLKDCGTAGSCFLFFIHKVLEAHGRAAETGGWENTGGQSQGRRFGQHVLVVIQIDSTKSWLLMFTFAVTLTFDMGSSNNLERVLASDSFFLILSGRQAKSLFDRKRLP